MGGSVVKCRNTTRRIIYISSIICMIFVAIKELSVQSMSTNKNLQIHASENLHSRVLEPGILYPTFKPGFCPSDAGGLFLFDRINVLYCAIPKAAMTQFNALFARANLPSEELDQSIIAKYPFLVYTNKVVGLGKKFLPCDPNNATTEGIMRNTKIKKVAVIREPLDRFISGFINKVLIHECNDCDVEVLLRTFVDETYQTMLGYWHSHEVPHSKTLRVNHFWPQYWMCDFQTQLNSYFIIQYNKSEEFNMLARQSAIEWGIPPDYVWKGWGTEKNDSFLENPTIHSSNAEITETIRSKLVGDLDMLKIFMKIYSVDYYYFDFVLPAEAANLCGNLSNLIFPICEHIFTVNKNI